MHLIRLRIFHGLIAHFFLVLSNSPLGPLRVFNSELSPSELQMIHQLEVFLLKLAVWLSDLYFGHHIFSDSLTLPFLL